jgi:hypothetical protein
MYKIQSVDTGVARLCVCEDAYLCSYICVGGWVGGWGVGVGVFVCVKTMMMCEMCMYAYENIYLRPCVACMLACMCA